MIFCMISERFIQSRCTKLKFLRGVLAGRVVVLIFLKKQGCLLGSVFINVCLEARWLGQKSGFYVPERPCTGLGLKLGDRHTPVSNNSPAKLTPAIFTWNSQPPSGDLTWSRHVNLRSRFRWQRVESRRIPALNERDVTRGQMVILMSRHFANCALETQTQK